MCSSITSCILKFFIFLSVLPSFAQQVKTERIQFKVSFLDENHYDPLSNGEEINTYDSLGKLIHRKTLPFMNTSDFFYENAKLFLIVEKSESMAADTTRIKYSGDTTFFYGSENTLTEVHDQKGRITEKINSDWFHLDCTFEYWDDTTIWISHDVVYGNEIRRYFDDNNCLVRIDYYEMDETDFEPVLVSKKWTYTYNYDDNGNWIQRKKFQEGQLVQLDEKQLTYY